METLASNPRGNGRYTKVEARPPKKKRKGRRVSSRRRTSPLERRAIWAVAALGGAVAAFAGCEPTGFGLVNVFLTAGFAVIVSLAASRARRWTWLVLAGLTVLGASGVWLAVAGLSLAVGLGASVLSRRRIYGAVVGALAVQSLLRLPEVGFPLGSAALTAVAVAPVLVSGYIATPRKTHRIVHRSLLVGLGLLVLGLVTFGIAAGLGYSSGNRGAADARDGLKAIRDGKTERAASLLRSAEHEFGDLEAKMDAWWAKPAQLVPVLSQQSTTLARTAGEGRRVAATASDVSAKVDYETLRYRDGRVNLDRIRQAQQPLAGASKTFSAVLDESERERSPWVAGPLNDKVDEFRDELRKATHETVLASDAANVLPGLLGGDGQRRYFVAFTTPSELRGLGGFMGNWAVITATDGRLEMTRHGRAAELGRYPGSEQRLVTTDRDYAARYGRFRVGRFFQDVTLSPDMPTVAKVIGELYPQTPEGEKIDGALAIDPQGLAALLELSGPITVDGLAEPLTSKNAVEILTKRQYTDIDNRAERADILDQAGEKTFEKLVHSDLPGPRRLADVLYSAVDRNRIMFSVDNPAEQAFLGGLKVTGAFPKPAGTDFFSLRTQNRGNNKIDVFLKRRVDYEVSFDPQTRAVQATATITLQNDAPATGLPDAIIGSNDQGLPKGTNALYLNFYTPHGLKDAKIGDQSVSMEYQRELGYAVYSREIQIPPGGSVVVKLDLFGTIKVPGDRYELDIAAQPTITPDHDVVTVRSGNDYRFVSAGPKGGAALAVQPRRDEAVWSGDSPTDVHLAVRSVER